MSENLKKNTDSFLSDEAKETLQELLGIGDSDIQIDDTLSIEGAAADAKATGDAIANIHPSDEQVADAVADWLDEHPEAITVTDGSISYDKLSDELQNYLDDLSIGDIDSSGTGKYYPVLQDGGMYGSTGKNYGSDVRARTEFIPVTPGQPVIICHSFTVSSSTNPYVLEFANNSVTTDSNNVRLTAYNATSQRYQVTVSANTHYIRIMTYASAADSDGKLWIEIPAHEYIVLKPASKVYATVSNMIADTSLEPGNIVCTSGFNTDDDFGGGQYYILSSGVVNNCTVFALDNGLYAHRHFDKPYVYLESFGYPTATIDQINAIMAMNGLHELRCNNITTDSSIKIGNYDFTFNKITYSGTDFAVIVDSITRRKIIGQTVRSNNGSCIKLVSNHGSCVRNIIQVNELVANDIGLGIFPTNSNGIMHNFYNIRYIESKLYGVRSYIPANTSNYSWEGEELFSISQITAKNTNNNAVAVSLKIEPVNNITADGTITGLTFLNLAVEDSNVGIDINCGIINPNHPDACIKSIYVNNMRGRETYTSGMWLTGYGYIRDVYIKTTAPTRLFQWDLNTTVGSEPCFIDGYICFEEQTLPVADGLMFRMGKKYIANRHCGTFNITQDIDFSMLNNVPNSSDPNWTIARRLFFCDTFAIDSSLRGQTVNIGLTHFLDKAADGLKFIIPAATQADGAVTVKVKYYFPQKVITLTNTSADTHVYQIMVNPVGASWSSDVRFVVKDLGVPDQDVTVAYNYVEPTA